MSQTTKEIPVWIGGESGQRKRYLRALEKDLAAEFGPQWREKLASNTVVKPYSSSCLGKDTFIGFVIAACRFI